MRVRFPLPAPIKQPCGFGAAIDRGPDALGLIAEVKKASLSTGTIAESFDPILIAKAYESAGAHAVSV